jgi:UDP-N-acetylbacillosamine N-acetyltransferase
MHNKLDTNKLLVIFGCGGHARSLADVAIANHMSRLIFVDENARVNEKSFGFDVLTQFNNQEDAYYITAIGDNHQRAKKFATLDPQKIIALISNNAYVGMNAKIGAGVLVAHGAHIGPNATIGENTIINTHAIIEHDCTIGKHCHISVNSVVAGKCQIGDYVMIGTGATVIDNIMICSNVTVGGGAVVVNDIHESGVYVGVPARKIS